MKEISRTIEFQNVKVQIVEGTTNAGTNDDKYYITIHSQRPLIYYGQVTRQVTFCVVGFDALQELCAAFAHFGGDEQYALLNAPITLGAPGEGVSKAVQS